MKVSPLVMSFIKMILGAGVPDRAHAARKGPAPRETRQRRRTAQRVLPVEQQTDGLHLGGCFHRRPQERAPHNSKQGVPRTQASPLQCNGHRQRGGWVKRRPPDRVCGSSPTDASREGNPKGDSVGKWH